MGFILKEQFLKMEVMMQVWLLGGCYEALYSGAVIDGYSVFKLNI